MAIELQIKGDFELSPPLATAVRGALSPGTTVKRRPREGAKLEIASRLVAVTGLHIGARAVLFFRVLDKQRVNEAVNRVVACADAVLTATDGNLEMLFGGDKLLLRRKGGKLTLFLGASKPSEEFWRVFDRSEMLHHAHRFAREPGGRRSGRR